MELVSSCKCWTEFERSLETLGKTQKGRAFEELTKLHLLADPTYSSKITKLWHHSEIPQMVLDELGLKRKDVGIDLIAKVKDGTYWAIQCKFHQDRNKNVSYKEVSTFFSITERKKTFNKLSHRLISTSANGVSHIVYEKHPEKLGYLTSADFSKLSKHDFDVFRELLDGGHPVPKPYKPKSHQSVALDKCVTFFKDKKNTRGKIIHPCGSGKSLTGYWISQQLSANTILIAVPSLALVRQILGSWTREAIANYINMDWIAVCSDDDVKNSDDPSMYKVDLGIEVDTNPQVVANFLAKRSEGKKVLVTTYQSGHVVSEGIKKVGFTFDLGIYDEAHKTVGQKDKVFSHLLFDKNVKVKNRVFMTATEKVFKGNSDEYLSMDNPDVYGTIIDELSFKSALEQDPPILSDYKIVTTIVTKSEIEQLINDNDFVKSDGKDWTVEGDGSTFASLIALRKLVTERKLKHVVSFHSNIKRSKDFQNLNAKTTKVDSSFDILSTFHVSGKDSTGKRAAELERFVNAEPSLITNARCLTEGVDVPAIDAVLFADPKQSKIDIVQAAGRALRRFEGKDFGYIIVPVIMDEEAENPSNDAFNQIITVISAMGMSDERIIEEFKTIANGKGGGDKIINFNVPNVVRVKFVDLISNIRLQIWDRLSFGWVKGFSYLETFAKREGHTRVSSKHIEDNFKLGQWVSVRRGDYNKGKLLVERIKELEALPGWTWDVLETQYQEGLYFLERFVKREEHAIVSQSHLEEEFNLGPWINRLRQSYKKGELSEEKVKELEAFPGWTWDPTESQFQEGLDYLKKYIKREGHARVPNSHIEENFKLGKWVDRRRSTYNKNFLTKTKIKELEALPGWSWNILDTQYQEGLNMLEKFVKREGHSRVSSQHIEEKFKLGNWVSKRRDAYNKNKLSNESIKELEAFPGWAWDAIKSQYQEGLEQLKKFVKREGHARVPNSHIEENFKLGQWVTLRRISFKQNKLSLDKIKELETFPGWTWDPIESQFQEGLDYLKKYIKREGHANVNQKHIEDKFKLGQWVVVRRGDYNKGKLLVERIKELEALPGWTWDARETNYQEGISYLKKYFEREGHPNAHEDHIEENFKLGQWIKTQTTMYKANKLSMERIKHFESFDGWAWYRHDIPFQQGLKCLKTFTKREGHSRVPWSHVEGNFKLGRWTHKRKLSYKEGKLAETKIKILESFPSWNWD